MTLSLIPESAPFTPEQRAWLNGFFAGLMGLDGTPGVSATSEGRTIAVAEPSAEDFPWHDPNLPLAERLKLADSKPLPRKLMAAMAQLDCGTCGYLCQTYAEALATGAEKNLKLCQPGGSDTAKTLKQLMKDAEASGAAAPASASISAPTVSSPAPARAPAGYSRKNPFLARLIESVNLNKPGSAKETCHVVIDLADSGISYKVGDALGVWPTNWPILVDQIIEALDAEPDAPVTAPDGTDCTLRQALLEHCCLKSVEEDLARLLAEAAADSGDARRLLDLAQNDDALADHDLLDLLLTHPSARPSPQRLVEKLLPLQPRLYSIASSLKAHPGQVHLTVGKNETLLRNRLRKGVASTMFAQRLEPGAHVRVFVQTSHGFGVPADPETDLIMVGPGTGIAPFRAFLQERAATGADGRNWLFFGDQKRACDFLYEEEWRQYQQRGLLHRLETAFSRDGGEKQYVQHRMLENAEELWRWLDNGAHFRVCGDAKRMAADVDRTLKQIVAEAGGMGLEKAAAYVVQMSRDGRYQKDVY